MSCPVKKAMEEDLLKARGGGGISGGGLLSSSNNNSSGSSSSSNNGNVTASQTTATNTTTPTSSSSLSSSSPPSNVNINNPKNSTIRINTISSSPTPPTIDTTHFNYSNYSNNSLSSSPNLTPTNSLPSSPSKSLTTTNPNMRKISPPPILSVGRKVSPPNPNHVKFYTVLEDGPTKIMEDTNSEPSNYGSGEGSPRLRKTSNISTTSSLGSEADSEMGGEKKVDIRSLIEGIGTLIIPADYFVRRAMQNLINMRNPRVMEHLRNESSELFGEELLMRSYSDQNLRHEPISDDTLLSMADEAATKLGADRESVLRGAGEEYFKLCLSDYGKALRMLGSNLWEFFSNIDGLQDQVKEYPRFQGQQPPSFRCDWKKSHLNLHYYSLRHQILSFTAGTVQAVSKLLFNTELQLDISPNKDPNAPHHIFYISTASVDDNENSRNNLYPDQVNTSDNPTDSKIGVHTICASFPFHVIFDQDLQITQLGVSLAKMIAPEVATKGRDVGAYFDIIKPKVKLSFSAILSRVNSSFVVRTKDLSKNNHRLSQNLELKGQMLFLQETDSILFLGSPSVEKLDELLGKGLYISDIPIHDATRDVILVGEQTKAQDGLKKRMEQLKKSIETASHAVDEEKQKNVDLLLEIFPPTIAQKLWRGEQVEPMTVDDVTMLFSDIVGFTAICSTATPMQVVDMLNSLYTHFDQFCVDIDVYKIETIGDAYCVAGGLHRRSAYHAQQIAWMAVKMMAAAENEKSHDGNVIKMRIGIHTGRVLAGVVGRKMPRYCLFGNNVSIANKFESGSVPLIPSRAKT
ncbi:soluble guanylate cyclase subunit [Aplysia californica]|uniref:guanylate cyclase n=1 Tax=Aplysia californica TaxID=6500 RepID=Q7YWK7_APLCA|nr:soluble guanylate cyclase subunit [Aplysia californica]AAK97794.1 soluble guanylate cyclase subunit [Aplysia californica]